MKRLARLRAVYLKRLKNWQLLTRLTQKKRGRAKINKMINEREDISANTKNYKGWWDYYEQMHASKFNLASKLNNLEEMDTLLETYSLLRLNHEEIENKNKPIISEKIKSALKNFPTKAQK